MACARRLVLEHDNIHFKMSDDFPKEITTDLIPEYKWFLQYCDKRKRVKDATQFRFAIVCKKGCDTDKWGYIVIFDNESYLYRGLVGVIPVKSDLRFIYCGTEIIASALSICIWSGEFKRAYEREMLRKYDIMCPWLFPSWPDGCKHCKIKPYEKTLKLCKGCKNVYYCSRHCQKIDWKYKHRHNCKTRWWIKPLHYKKS